MTFYTIDGTPLPSIFSSKLNTATKKQYLEVKALNISDVGKYFLKGVIEKNGCVEELHFTVSVNAAPTVAFAAPIGTATTVGGPPAILNAYFGAVMKYKIADTQLRDTDMHEFIEMKTYTYSYAAKNYPNLDKYLPTKNLDIGKDYIYARCDKWLLSAGTAFFIT